MDTSGGNETILNITRAEINSRITVKSNKRTTQSNSADQLHEVSAIKLVVNQLTATCGVPSDGKGCILFIIV